MFPALLKFYVEISPIFIQQPKTFLVTENNTGIESLTITHY